MFAVALGAAGFLVASRVTATQDAATVITTNRVVTIRSKNGPRRVVTLSQTVTRPGESTVKTVLQDGRTVVVRASGETATVRGPVQQQVVTRNRTNTLVQTQTATVPTTVTTPGRTDTVTTEVTQPQRTVTDTESVTVTVTDEVTVTQTDTVTETVTDKRP
jgi:hypothetical protein